MIPGTNFKFKNLIIFTAPKGDDRRQKNVIKMKKWNNEQFFRYSTVEKYF